MSSKLREAVSRLVQEVEEEMLPEILSYSYSNYIRALIDDIKAALAEQRYEAEWNLGAEYEYAYCSHCGHQQWANWDSYRRAANNIGEFHKEYKFCPNCGFEMKGVNNEQ